MKSEIKVEEKYSHIEKIPYSRIQKGYTSIWKFMYPVYISLLGIVVSVPLWIWVNWGVAWKVFLTSVFLFFVSNGIFNMLKKSYIEHKNDLDSFDKIDYTK